MSYDYGDKYMFCQIFVYSYDRFKTILRTSQIYNHYKQKNVKFRRTKNVLFLFLETKIIFQYISIVQINP
jgi:hypothetical protein